MAHMTRPPPQVLHGADIPLVVRACVEPANVSLVTTSLDYGLVRLRDSAALPLVLRNTSLTCWAPWAMREMRSEAEKEPRAGGEASSSGGGGGGESEGGAGSTWIEFERTSGVLAPGEQVVVMATLHAVSGGGGGVPPQYRSIVRLEGPPGSRTSFLEALAVVVTPHATLSSPRVDLGATFIGVTVKAVVSISNLSLLPLDYRFSVDHPGEDPLAELRIKPDRGVLQPGGSTCVDLDIDIGLGLHQARQGVLQSGGPMGVGINTRAAPGPPGRGEGAGPALSIHLSASPSYCPRPSVCRTSISPR